MNRLASFAPQYLTALEIFLAIGPALFAQPSLRVTTPSTTFSPEGRPGRVRVDDVGGGRRFRGEPGAAVMLRGILKVPAAEVAEPKLLRLVVHFRTSASGPSLRSVQVLNGTNLVVRQDTTIRDDYSQKEILNSPAANAWDFKRSPVAVSAQSIVRLEIVFPSGFDSSIDPGEFVLLGVDVDFPRIPIDGGISGVLLVGKFRTQSQLNGMSPDDRRNTLITEIAGRTKDTAGHYQSMNDEDLAGSGALLVYLRETGSRTDAQIKTMSADDMRNTVIVEVGAQTHRGRDLQGLSNSDLIQFVLGRPSYIRGVLLIGRFRTQTQLNGMSPDDQRNTLITELVGRTRDNVSYYQRLRDADLGGVGALLLYLRETGSRTDAQIKTMSADDMRNTVIVEVAAQTGRGQDLQALSNLDLITQVLQRRPRK